MSRRMLHGFAPQFTVSPFAALSADVNSLVGRSLAPLKTQVQAVIAAIRGLISADPSRYSDGYNLVCKSQGALICRCVIEEMDDHKVDVFISLAGPQAGE